MRRARVLPTLSAVHRCLTEVLSAVDWVRCAARVAAGAQCCACHTMSKHAEQSSPAALVSAAPSLGCAWHMAAFHVCLSGSLGTGYASGLSMDAQNRKCLWRGCRKGGDRNRAPSPSYSLRLSTLSCSATAPGLLPLACCIDQLHRHAYGLPGTGQASPGVLCFGISSMNAADGMRGDALCTPPSHRCAVRPYPDLAPHQGRWHRHAASPMERHAFSSRFG